MAECMINLIKPSGTIIIEIQYLMNTLKDLTFDNIYHEHYNYWSLTSLVNFFSQFKIQIFKAEKINTHGGSLRIFITKKNKINIHESVKKILKEEEEYGVKRFTTYKNFGKKINEIKKNVLKNIKILKKNNDKIIGYGSPAKATTALNFFGISNQIDFIVEDNKLKLNKFVPGVNIPIYNKNKIIKSKPTILVLAGIF